MNYSEFKIKAYPESKKESDHNLTLVSRIYRKFGLVLGFLCYKIGLSANAVSLFRVVVVLVCFYFLTLSGKEYLQFRIAAVCLLLLMKILDYADGAIARASNVSSELGVRLDSFSDRPVRAGMILALFGYYSDILFMIPYAIFLEWVIHQFGRALKEEKTGGSQATAKRKFFSLMLDTSKDVNEAQPDSTGLLLLNLYSKLFKSDFMHFIILPLVLVVLNNKETASLLSTVSLVIICLYTSVMFLRFIGGVREYSGKKAC